MTEGRPGGRRTRRRSPRPRRSLEADAGDVELGVPDGAGREDHRVVELPQLLQGDVGPELDVRQQADVAAVHHAVQRGDDLLDARVVGCDAVANQPERCREAFEQVDRDVEVGLRQDVGGVDACRPGPDDGDAQRTVRAHD